MTYLNKKIKIDHIAKSEGHMGFVAHIIKGDLKSARLEIHEGARLIEGLLIGRQYDEAPMITARICGLCPVVHNICSLKAIEDALNIQVSPQTKLLRELLLYGQIIQSHSLHLFILSEDPRILSLREWINNFVALIAGRSLHPLTTMIGGFRKLPDPQKLNSLMKKYFQVLRIAVDLVSQFKKQPNFYRKTKFKALKTIYGNGTGILPLELQKGVVKRTKQTYMVGALARLHSYQYKFSDLSLPCYNTFYNIYAQAVEILHYLEEIKRLIPQSFKESKVKYKLKAGKGRAGCEAPRGTLYHFYEIDQKGKIIKARIITPTAQFLNNLEADLKEYLRDDWDKEKAKALIRAYDPCISCAVH